VESTQVRICDILFRPILLPAHPSSLGQSSRNKLIIFADGTYLELFNWFDKPPAEDAKDRPMRVWAKKQPGLIDFALSSLPTSTAEAHFDTCVARLQTGEGDGGLGVGYTAPEAGGRTRKDGVQVRWKVSRPEFAQAVNTPDEPLFPNGRIDAPFFCYDVTSRDVRVPFEDKEKTTHPCGATGVAAVEILVPKAQMDAYVKLYSSILGSSPKVVDEDDKENGVIFQVDLPVQRAGLSAIRLRSEQNERDVAWLMERGIGISGLTLALGEGQAGVKGRLGAEGIPSTISLQ
jgi:Glyoxalase-like domain